MSHEMIRYEAEAEYGTDRVTELEVTWKGPSSELDLVDVWPLLPDADSIPVTWPNTDEVATDPVGEGG